ncbi:hypothetical protein FBU30_009049 [Linnemannia zychae]|nr:hypothetical protein FBU30_009049 [Linnemannia zychae]
MSKSQSNYSSNTPANNKNNSSPPSDMLLNYTCPQCKNNDVIDWCGRCRTCLDCCKEFRAHGNAHIAFREAETKLPKRLSGCEHFEILHIIYTEK